MPIKKYYDKIKLAKICASCCKRLVSISAHCDICKKANRERRNKLRRERRKQRKCLCCGNKLYHKSKQFCQKHYKIYKKTWDNRKKQRTIYNRNYKASRIIRRKCTRCGKSLLLNENSRCFSCKKRENELKRLRNKTEEAKYLLQLRRRLKIIKGLCTYCSKKREQLNKSACNSCLKKRSENARQNRQQTRKILQNKEMWEITKQT
jgi:hypothetical protein